MSNDGFFFVESEFELQFGYYIYFWINTLEKEIKVIEKKQHKNKGGRYHHVTDKNIKNQKNKNENKPSPEHTMKLLVNT